MVLQDFAKLVLGPGCVALSRNYDHGFDFSVDTEDIIRGDPMEQLQNAIKIAESFRTLVYQISGRLLSYVGEQQEENISLPSLCSPDFHSLMGLVKSYMEAHKVWSTEHAEHSPSVRMHI